TGVDHHAGRLVDDGEVGVLIDDVEGDFFGLRLKRGGNENAADGDGFAASKFERGFFGLAVDEDFFIGDEALNARAADGFGLGGEDDREVLVETYSGGFDGDGEDAWI